METRDKPKYQQVIEELSGEIMTGRYKPGAKLPSEAALVKRFGVSRITVAHAVRELQRRGMIDRVAGSGSYVKKGARQGLLFGLVIPNLGETEIFEPICQAIAGSPDSEGHALLWAHAKGAGATKGEQALELCEHSIDRRVDGVFFAPLEMAAESAAVNETVMRRFREAEIPVVLLDRRPERGRGRDRCDLVGIDNHQAGFLAADHLVKQGARRIGFIAVEHQASTVLARIGGYREAIGEAEPLVFEMKSGVIPEELTCCDGIVCSNDRIAGLLMRALLARGIRIPEQMRIVGIDDVSYAPLLPVALTTVRQPCRDIGEAALRLMMERLEKPQMPAREVLLDCELVVRESCGARL